MNKYIITSLISLIISQIIKYTIEKIKNKKVSIKRLYNGMGGVPSTHSSFTVSLTTLIFLDYGITSTYFAISLTFTLITLYDAIGIRYEVGKHAKILNQIDNTYNLKEEIGHTLKEVILGSILGIIISIIMFAFFTLKWYNYKERRIHMNKIIKELIPYIIILLVVIIIRTYIITPVTVVGDSMYPNLKDKEVLLLSKISYKLNYIKRFDIVVINMQDEEIIKRVIGLPGEYVEYKDNKLYINNNYVEETYDYAKTKDFDLLDVCLKQTTNEINCSENTIPDNYYLVLGDNRGISKDSRSIGLIKKEDIIGKAVFRFYPLNKIGIIK